jgi:hypothetical protein
MPSGQKWIENNLIVVASITVGIAVVQVWWSEIRQGHGVKGGIGEVKLLYRYGDQRLDKDMGVKGGIGVV